MNPRANQPDNDPEKLKHLLALLDRLTEAGFIKRHGYVQDSHIVEFTGRGRMLQQAIADIERFGITDADRLGLWNIFRMSGPIR